MEKGIMAEQQEMDVGIYTLLLCPCERRERLDVLIVTFSSGSGCWGDLDCTREPSPALSRDGNTPKSAKRNL